MGNGHASSATKAKLQLCFYCPSGTAGVCILSEGQYAPIGGLGAATMNKPSNRCRAAGTSLALFILAREEHSLRPWCSECSEGVSMDSAVCRRRTDDAKSRPAEGCLHRPDGVDLSNDYICVL